MKNLFLTLSGICFFALFCSAQGTSYKVDEQDAARKCCGHNHYNPNYRIGVDLQAGVNRLNNLQDFNTQTAGSGYSFGVTVDRMLLNKSLTVSTGVSFANKKMNYETEVLESNPYTSEKTSSLVEISNNGSFIEIPLAIRYRGPLMPNNMKPYAQVGVVNEFLVNGNTSHIVERKGTEEIFASDLNKYNLGLTMGAGLEFAIGCRTFSAGLNMKKGLKAVKSSEVFQQNTYGVQFGYYF